MYLVEEYAEGRGREYVGVFYNKDDAESFIGLRRATFSKRARALLEYDIIDVPLNPSTTI
jgi:hypothetical protein